jgi:hypothetical protein
MTLQEYINGLLELVKENPSTADMKVVYAIDDEGNAFHSVGNTPTLGIFEDNEFHQPNDEDNDDEDFEFNADCIN